MLSRVKGSSSLKSRAWHLFQIRLNYNMASCNLQIADTAIFLEPEMCHNTALILFSSRGLMLYTLCKYSTVFYKNHTFLVHLQYFL